MTVPDPSASGLEALLLAHREALLRFLRARGAGDEAEDILQDVWLKVAEQRQGPIANPLSYLYRAAENLMRDRRKSQLRRLGRDRAWLDTRAGQSDGAEGAAIARDEVRTVEARLAELGERTGLILRRFRLDGVAQHDIASELGISRSAVEKHLQKAYRLLLAIKRDSDAE